MSRDYCDVCNFELKSCTCSKMTERERWRYTFAGQAMQALIINPGTRPSKSMGLFVDSVEAADRLLAELEISCQAV